MYEDQLKALRSHMTPAASPMVESLWSPLTPLTPSALATPTSSRFPPSLIKSKYDDWLQER